MNKSITELKKTFEKYSHILNSIQAIKIAINNHKIDNLDKKHVLFTYQKILKITLMFEGFAVLKKAEGSEDIIFESSFIQQEEI